MKVIIVGATGAIGGVILQHTLQHKAVTEVVALTRKPFSSTYTSSTKLSNIIVENFGALENVEEATWNQLVDADALVWAVGTYTLDEDVNLKYPLAFQEEFAKRRTVTSPPTQSKISMFRFILLSGAFVETDQARRLFFLRDQRRMKGVLQAKTLEFSNARSDTWEAIVIRPGGVLYGGNTWRNWFVEMLLGKGLAIKGEELGAFVAELVVQGSRSSVVENGSMVEGGRRVLREKEGGE